MLQLYRVIYTPHNTDTRIKVTKPMTLQKAINTASELTKENTTDNLCYSLELVMENAEC
ncbi:hypothetical protein kac65v162_gp129 [Nodularia phage vB_NspS-kac65v162]|jgi:hypothetical protein|uniref:Uncharacterized protein n=6 Tax=Ravarandavirus TaxID=2843444 RepID=A0A482MKE4_9CAUD|nr:hypothetical protein HWA92_gp117 [Nodularia phage vB_NpeS-2AV2]YP_009844732.1 hypothetical protein HWC12_gp188 [Nodularia phage vB_NspS-kac65v151]YP_009844939.1 hypothetical protein HWC13_gp181 [Nodularia phage vB_NspS-kac68v161]QBQ73367.1 hypothetical protein kac65v161_gp129 [Nodularia phage vB_NspS-kac65v161]QBQ73573.1 hypothetical protein kac65v162_gp129 [Nodularia phage vB_NspS-kac65v162]QBQ73976.1 hypothetical protein kac68v162_gp128 [Nodularia phage vB_NspS-kac68v162]ALY07569.1 hypot